MVPAPDALYASIASRILAGASAPYTFVKRASRLSPLGSGIKLAPPLFLLFGVSFLPTAFAGLSPDLLSLFVVPEPFLRLLLLT